MKEVKELYSACLYIDGEGGQTADVMLITLPAWINWKIPPIKLYTLPFAKFLSNQMLFTKCGLSTKQKIDIMQMNNCDIGQRVFVPDMKTGRVLCNAEQVHNVVYT
ncbi:hypothetical protein GHT06_017779 [Daphnia sinensis]|uniref:Uncharacterized protein n=1 Tax=Daphnia sinensis TaxID=1820382 RepID=A0AAD5KM96_9CRUS|nr:hypothetical protein GHT06_017779 [Daphnia sinensis]